MKPYSFIGRIKTTIAVVREHGQREQRRKDVLSAIAVKREPRRRGRRTGGAFSSYDDYLRSDWWKSIRNHTLSYLNYKCEFCYGRATSVHHIRYPIRKDLGAESIEYHCVVCSRCHDVAHGGPCEDDPTKCAFCSSRATTVLRVEIRKSTQRSQSVCWRFYYLARGKRKKAHRWTFEEYVKWCADWSARLPPLISRAQADSSDKVDAIAGTGLTLEAFEGAVRAEGARDKERNEKQKEIRGLSSEEMEQRWADRDRLKLDSDYRKLLRAEIRKKKGIEPF